MQQLVGRQPRPHAVQCVRHLRCAAQATSQVGLLLGARPVVVQLLDPPGEAGTVVVGQRTEHMGLHESSAHVVGPRAAAGQGDDLFGGTGTEAQDPGTERDLKVLAERRAGGSARPDRER